MTTHEDESQQEVWPTLEETEAWDNADYIGPETGRYSPDALEKVINSVVATSDALAHDPKQRMIHDTHPQATHLDDIAAIREALAENDPDGYGKWYAGIKEQKQAAKDEADSSVETFSELHSEIVHAALGQLAVNPNVMHHDLEIAAPFKSEYKGEPVELQVVTTSEDGQSPKTTDEKRAFVAIEIFSPPIPFDNEDYLERLRHIKDSGDASSKLLGPVLKDEKLVKIADVFKFIPGRKGFRGVLRREIIANETGSENGRESYNQNVNVDIDREQLPIAVNLEEGGYVLEKDEQGIEELKQILEAVKNAKALKS